MPRDWILYVEDIHLAIVEIYSFTSGMKSGEDLAGNHLVFRATERNFEIIGEAAKNLPKVIREKYPHLDWKGICGLRDILAHGYFDVEANVLWTLINTKLHDLQKVIKEILNENK